MYVYKWQVLLATGGGHLVYLEIGDGVLTEVKHAQLEHDVSCLDINPIGYDPNCSFVYSFATILYRSLNLFKKGSVKELGSSSQSIGTFCLSTFLFSLGTR